MAAEVLDAPDDGRANEIAICIAHACSDRCVGYELWQRDRKVFRKMPLDGTHPFISTEIQEAVIEREERILQSRSSIARSRTLLARLDDLRNGRA